jgi:hypothetical protein
MVRKTTELQSVLGGPVCRGMDGPVCRGIGGTLCRVFRGPVYAYSPVYDRNRKRNAKK